MSTLTEINEYLDQTRDLPVAELNHLIARMDQSAEPQFSQGFAHSILGYMKMSEINGEVATFEQGRAKAAKLKANHEWLFAEPLEEAEQPVVAEVVKAPKVVKEKTEKKSDIARRIYAGLADKSKANVLKVFEKELNTTIQGANSYYYAVGGEKSGKRGRKPSATTSTKVAYVRKTPVGTPTKRELATSLFSSAPDKSRATIVSRFVTELGLTKNGATTYYYAVGGAHMRATK